MLGEDIVHSEDNLVSGSEDNYAVGYQERGLADGGDE
jgi:hypothetical protein